MPTKEDILTLSVGVAVSSVGNMNFAARQVSNLLEPTHGPKGLTPDIITTLDPEQTLKGVVTDIVDTLVPTQTLTTNIKRGDTVGTLVPSQTVVSRTKNGITETVLEPTQTINTGASTLSNASVSRHTLAIGFRARDGGTFKKTITNTLVPRQGIIGYGPATVTLGATRYVTKNVATN